MIVNFNYTNTLSKYDIYESYHIHGKFDEQIIIGTELPSDADNYMIDVPSKSIISKNFNLKSSERQSLKNGYQYKIKKEFEDFLKSNVEYEVVVIGHSLGRTDGDILYKIMKSANKIKFYSINKDRDENEIRDKLLKIKLDPEDYILEVVEYGEFYNKLFPYFKDVEDLVTYIDSIVHKIDYHNSMLPDLEDVYPEFLSTISSDLP